MGKKETKGERFKEFLAEAEDLLNTMANGLMALGKGVRTGDYDPVMLNSVFRSAHTLKGMSGLFDFKGMASLSHAMEDTLDALRMGKSDFNGKTFDTLMAAHELMGKIIAARGDEKLKPEIDNVKSLLSKVSCKRDAPLLTGVDAEVLKALTEYEVHRLSENLKAGRSVFCINASFPLTTFDRGYLELTELIKTECEIIATLPSTRSSPDTLFFDIFAGTVRNRDSLIALLQGKASIEVKPVAGPEAQGAPQAVPGAKEAHSGFAASSTLRRVGNVVRVNIEKLDRILSAVSELGIINSTISRLSAELKNQSRLSVYGIELARIDKYLERKLNELRNSVLDVRMVPIGSLFNRFETVLNKLSRETGKEFVLETNGDETELDKLIIEELADPLMHIITNMVDHGIEPPEQRVAIGKDRAGKITLSAYQKGNHAVVEVRDDGAGIDIERVRRKAVEKGVLKATQAASMTAQEVLELIFIPGVSTKDVVTETSGRGVGMDVVKENITRLSGIIDIETVRGRGTRFVITIPITLAIIQTLIIEDAGERYAVPLNSVIEIIELRSPEEYSQDTEQINVNGRDIPAARLSRFFQKPGAARDSYFGIVAGLAEHRVCIVVDRLLEELDLVIKPLPGFLKVPGVAGAADMGEKGTILVLDITGILEHAVAKKQLARA